MFVEVFGLKETGYFGKDHLMIDFYNSARISAKDFPGKIIDD